MNLYVNAVDELVAHDEDRATVGFILCADRNEAVTQMTLQGIATPIGVTRHTAGERGIAITGEDAQLTAGVEEEIQELNRAKQQVAEFAVRRVRELAQGEGKGG